jgi:hypothetical protein
MKIMEHFVLLHSLYKYGDQPILAESYPEAVKLLFRLKCRAEVIGTWIYCYPSPLIAAQVKLTGFWYSFHHGLLCTPARPKADQRGMKALRK